MAKKKEATNEAEVAATAPEELDTPVSAEHDEPEAAPVVAEDGGNAAEAPGTEFADEPPAAAPDADGGLSDDSDTTAAGAPAQTEEVGAEGDDAAPSDTETVEGTEPPAGGVGNDGEGSADGAKGSGPLGEGASDAGDPASDDGRPALSEGNADGGNASASDGQSGDDGDAAPDDGGAAEGTGDPDGSNGSDAPSAPVDPALIATDDAVTAAEMAANCVRHHVAYAAYPDDWRMRLFSGQAHSRGTNAMAACIRNIGPERAQPHVLAQQLKILDIIDDAELTPAETLVVKIFADTLAAVDAFAKGEAARLEAEAASASAPAPWPADETTLEGVDDPLGTW